MTPPAAVKVFGDRLDAAMRYAELLATAGVERGLIGPRETDRLWDRHLLNCAVLAEAVAAPVRMGDSGTTFAPPEIVDVGSGAGLPGIPLALVLPEARVTLLEPMERRCRFLDEAVTRLGLGGRVKVLRGRAPDVAAPPSGRSFDVAVARAVAPLERLGAVLLPLVRPGGVMLAMRGSRILTELAEARSGLDSQGWREVDVMTCGADLVAEPTRVLRAVRSVEPARGDERGRRGGGEQHDEKQARRTARPRRAREAGRDQPARGRARST